MKSEKSSGISHFARTNWRNQNLTFGIKREDRRRHFYVVGKTGMGKSTLLENLVAQDIQNGHGVAVIDPHGDLVERVLDFIPPSRINDTIYFNPADTEYPIGFNVLEQVDVRERHLVASGLIQVFKKIWSDSWGPRLEYVLRNAILALLENPGNTLLGIPRLLNDRRFRLQIIRGLKDPVVKNFWAVEYETYPKAFRAEIISPIQNKVGQFLSTPIIRNIVGQTKTRFNLRDVMDSGKILLLNLAKGRVGEDNGALLGAMMITKLQLAAMRRVDTPESQRKDFYLYVDEFQNYATESFATILSEARKYRLNLTIAHQYLAQLEDPVRSAVFGNVGTIVCFRIGSEDSEFVEREFLPKFTDTDLQCLPQYSIYLKLSIDGVTSDPFSAVTLPPAAVSYGSGQKVISQSRGRYGTPRRVVEEKILRWKEKEQPVDF